MDKYLLKNAKWSKYGWEDNTFQFLFGDFVDTDGEDFYFFIVYVKETNEFVFHMTYKDEEIVYGCGNAQVDEFFERHMSKETMEAIKVYMLEVMSDKKNYLLNVTLHLHDVLADEDDTERGLFLICTDNEISEAEMKSIFSTVHKLLDTANPTDEAFPISYYDKGADINTLMEGVGNYTKWELKEVFSNMGHMPKIDNSYVIEQWLDVKW